MFSLPSSRWLVTPALLLFVVAASIRLCLQIHGLIVLGPAQHILNSFAKPSFEISFKASLQPHTSLQDRFLAQYHLSTNDATPNLHVAQLLLVCQQELNPYTNHIRLSAFPILNISMVPSAADSTPDEFRNNKYFNPTIIPLPSYVAASSLTPYEYLLVSRLVTEGTHQESHICFANICSLSDSPSRSQSRTCTDDDLELLGQNGGMRCVTRPEKVNIPSTPARKCTGKWSIFPDIPGFHDPRIFWSGRGEPLIEVNSGSMYGCIGLWLQDLRSVFPPLESALRRKRRSTTDDSEQQERKASVVEDVNGLGAIVGYPGLTELTRNPRNSRASIEKNWIVFFSSEDEMWIQYNAMGKATVRSNSSTLPSHSSGRTLSKVLSHGYATRNIASTLEHPCFDIDSPKHITDPLNNTGHWHQGTNSLRLILCTRSTFHTRTCILSPPNADAIALSDLAYEELLRASGAIVHFSIIHRKFTNEMDLPMRYERYVTVWEARPPYRFVAVSKYPVVFGTERVRPWRIEQDGAREGRDGDVGMEDETEAYFTYTPSIAWAFRGQDTSGDQINRERGRENLGTGYLDDEVIVGIGMDDVRQGFVRVPIKELLRCLRGCHGV